MSAAPALLWSALLLAPPSPPVFEAEAHRVRVEVLVTLDGRPVRGLTAADFEVLDSGILQELEPLVEESLPVDTVLCLDRSASVTGAKLAELRRAAFAYLQQLRPGEQAALAAFSNRVDLDQPLTPDLDLVRAAMNRQRRVGSTSLADAVYASLRLAGPGSRRLVVVVFSDGRENASWLRPGQVIEAARRSNLVVYGVLAGDKAERDASLLRQVTRATGGRVFEAGRAEDLESRFLAVLEDVRSRYLLSFAPSNARAGWHPLEVRLKRGRGTVLARPDYWQPPR